MIRITFTLLLLVSLIACKNEVNQDEQTVETVTEVETLNYKESTDAFAASIEQAHNKATFRAQDAVSFNIAIQFGGNERLNGKMTLKTDSSQGLIELNDENKIYVDNDQVFVSPELAENKGLRFDAYTWSYFFLFPHKLGDEGTQWSQAQDMEWNNTKYNTKKLSFKAGSGDTPDDWYVVYKDKNNNQLTAASYIVTFGKSKDKAEADPHAISYSDYVVVDEVPFAKDWKFWGWNEKDGFGKDQIGAAQLNDFKFLDTDSATFKAPANYVEIK